MAEKHTPNWFVGTMGMSKRAWSALWNSELTIVRAGSFVVAAVWGDSDEEESERARLIAAAPAMLAALELIANGREVLLDDGSTVVVDLDDPAAVARAAIAQAKGE